MLMNATEFRQRLQEFSMSTKALITEAIGIDGMAHEAIHIAAETDYSEEEVVRRLNELKASTLKKTEQGQ